MARTREGLFDVRVVERNIAAGLVTREEYQAWLVALADDSGLVLHTRTRMEPVVIAERDENSSYEPDLDPDEG